MNLEESAQLMTNQQFRGRVKAACLRYANRLLTETTGTNAQKRWAGQVYGSPDAVATSVQPATVMEPGVQSIGADIDDGGLQFAVENAVQKVLSL